MKVFGFAASVKPHFKYRHLHAGLISTPTGCHGSSNCWPDALKPHPSPCSYLVESSEGFVRPWLFSSHTLLASSFPMDDITLMSSMGQSSRSRDRTRERWVPRFRWIPEHSMHMRAPRFKLAQLGSVGRRAEGPMWSDHHRSLTALGVSATKP